MPGLRDWFAIFSSGKHTDRYGRTQFFSRDDLDGIVKNHDSDHPSPCVITHEELYSPFAYAQVPELRRDGDVLMARCNPETIEQQFEKLVADGRLYNRSVTLLPAGDDGWKLANVAFLGAEPPAVEGLAPIRFSAQGLTFENGAWDQLEEKRHYAEILGRLKRLMDKVFGEDDPEAIPSWRVEGAREDVGAAREKANQTEGGQSMSEYSQADLDAEKEKAARAAAEQVRRKFAAEQEALKKQHLELGRAEVERRISGLVDAGKLLPKQTDGLSEFALGLDSQPSLSFSRGGEETGEPVQVSPREYFFGLLEEQESQLKLKHPVGDEQVSRVDAADAAHIQKAAREYQAAEAGKGRTVSNADAVRYVVNLEESQ